MQPAVLKRASLKPAALALALVLALPAAAPVRAADAPAAATVAPAWVAASNRYAQILLDAQGPFQPEQMSFLGVPGYDDQVADLGPDNQARFRAATSRAKAQLLARSAGETDSNVRQDIAILTKAADDAIEASTVNERLVRPFADVGQTVFQGLQGLLNDQTQPERRALALKRLQRYAGLAPGSTSLATLARQRYEERADPKLLQPTQVEVQQSLDNVPTYVGGIRDLFAKYHVDAAPEIAALQKQLDDYTAWTKTTVLPHARTTYSLPPELYALQLKNVGIDIDPRALIERAKFEFMHEMLNRENVAAVIPALNEALRIRDVVEGALRHCDHVVVIDDGSDDDTLACIADLPVTVLQHPQRMLRCRYSVTEKMVSWVAISR